MYSGTCLKQMALLAIKAGCRYGFDLLHDATSLHYVLLKKGLTSQIQKNFITTTPRQTVAVQADTPLSPAHLVSEVKPVLKFAKLSDNATVPTKGSPRAAGFDLYSAHDCSIPPMNKALVMTDIQIAVPTGCYGRVAPRSGLAAQHFIDVGGGVIDEDYRGNVGIVLFNFNKETFQVRKGDRIAQLICEKICFPDLEQHEALDETQRGAGGFGSTGSK